MKEKDMDKSNNEYFTDEDYLDMASTSSANDCTGLIPQGSNETNSAKDYNDLYQFGVPHAASKAAGESADKTSPNASNALSSKASTSNSNKSSHNPPNTSSNMWNKTSNMASNKSSNSPK